MDRLRTIVEWIGAHKLVSFLVLALLSAAVYGSVYVSRANAGLLSDPIRNGDIIDAVYGIGTVSPYQRLSFNPLVGSTVQKNYVIEGDRVVKGAPLVQTAEAGLVRAPFDGAVNFLPYKAGENVYATTPLMILTDLTHLYIVVSIEQQGALRVKVGQTARVSFDSLREQTFEGKVTAVYSYSSNFLARIENINLPPTVLPDMTCDVAIVIGVHKDALLIPVVAFENGEVKVKRGKQLPRPTPVTLGVTDGTWAEVLKGDIKPGDRLMIRKQVNQ